jgi:hypothetical protein
MNEDITDDTEAHASIRSAADCASGWNGSLELWVPPTHEGTPCPEPIRSKLLALRAAAEARAAQQRARGLCL